VLLGEYLGPRAGKPRWCVRRYNVTL